jgi:hypothetical protein
MMLRTYVGKLLRRWLGRNGRSEVPLTSQRAIPLLALNLLAVPKPPQG